MVLAGRSTLPITAIIDTAPEPALSIMRLHRQTACKPPFFPMSASCWTPSKTSSAQSTTLHALDLTDHVTFCNTIVRQT